MLSLLKYDQFQLFHNFLGDHFVQTLKLSSKIWLFGNQKLYNFIDLIALNLDRLTHNFTYFVDFFQVFFVHLELILLLKRHVHFGPQFVIYRFEHQISYTCLLASLLDFGPYVGILEDEAGPPLIFWLFNAKQPGRKPLKLGFTSTLSDGDYILPCYVIIILIPVHRRKCVLAVFWLGNRTGHRYS